MIFMSAEIIRSSVCFLSLFNTPVGDFMKKSGTLIVSALLTFGLAAGVMAADTPAAAAPAAAAASPAASMDAPKAKHHHRKHHKKAASSMEAAPAAK